MSVKIALILIVVGAALIIAPLLVDAYDVYTGNALAIERERTFQAQEHTKQVSISWDGALKLIIAVLSLICVTSIVCFAMTRRQAVPPGYIIIPRSELAHTRYRLPQPRREEWEPSQIVIPEWSEVEG